MNKNGISFLVTVYNKEKYIPAMLNSLKSQKGNFHREYVIVDDGSQDNSLTVTKRITKKWKNTKIITKKNTGPSKATNIGAKYCTQKYIKIVDADDVLSPFASEVLLSTMEKHNLDLLYGKGIWVEDPQKYVFEEKGGDPEVLIYKNALEEFIKKGMGGSTTIMFRNDAFQDTGGCDEKTFVQDYSLPLRFAWKKKKIGRITTLINVAPKEVDQRIMGSKAQLLHDLTYTMFNFVKENPNLPYFLKAIAVHRCAGRSWKWARRHQNKKIFSKHFIRYVRSIIPIFLSAEDRIKKSLEVWKDEKVRYGKE